jgi:hypothetical protein
MKQRARLAPGSSVAIGYARVSTGKQTLALQEEDLLAATGCARLFTDTGSSAKTERPGVAPALDFLCRQFGVSCPTLTRYLGSKRAATQPVVPAQNRST